MIFTVLWRRQSKAAAILSPILGLATGLAVWLSTASHFGGAVSVATTGEVLPCVYGTVASCFSPILYSVLITLVRPQNYDWDEFKKEKLALEKLESDLTTVHHEVRADSINVEEGGVRSASLDAQELKRWGRIAAFWSAATFLGHWVLWPLPMYGSHYVFEKKVRWIRCRRDGKVTLADSQQFYIAWVVVGIIWLWATLFVATLYPIFDGGVQQIVQVYRGLRGKHTSNGLEGGKVVGDSSTSPSSPSNGSVSDGGQGKEKGEAF